MSFNKQQLRALLIPLVIEQVLTGLMGVADTLMVSNVGEAAISGVSLVDSINLLFVYFFSALAAGGTIICAQYTGRDDEEHVRLTARQVMLACLALSTAFGVTLILLRRQVLRLIFGNAARSQIKYRFLGNSPDFCLVTNISLVAFNIHYGQSIRF